MKLRDALKLHNGDEVVVKNSGDIRMVIDTEYVPKEEANNVAGFSVMLDDGNWYGYKEIR
jgi:hypothetical protein